MLFIFLAFIVNLSHGVTLDDALRSAVAKNESLAKSGEKVVQAEENLDKALSGPQPSLALNANFIKQPEPDNPLARQFSPSEQTTAFLSLKQPLFRGFREFAVLRQQRDLLDAARSSRLRTLGEVFQNVSTAYFEVLALEQDLRNLEDQRRLYSERAKNLVARARRGQSARNEPLMAQSAEAVTDADIQVVKSKLKAARENFKILSDLPADSHLTDLNADDNGVVKVQNLEFYLKRLSDRPDVLAAKSAADAAAESVKVARGAHWPTLDATGNYYLKRPEMQKDLKWDLRLDLTFPIYEGGLRMAETREASSKKREADLDFHQIRRLAEAEVRTLHEAAQTKIKYLEALKRAKELTLQSSQELERDYRRGLARNIDVQQSLVDYGNARRKFDQARYEARLDMIKLDRAANILPPVMQQFANSLKE